MFKKLKRKLSNKYDANIFFLSITTSLAVPSILIVFFGFMLNPDMLSEFPILYKFFESMHSIYNSFISGVYDLIQTEPDIGDALDIVDIVLGLVGRIILGLWILSTVLWIILSVNIKIERMINKLKANYNKKKAKRKERKQEKEVENALKNSPFNFATPSSDSAKTTGSFFGSTGSNAAYGNNNGENETTVAKKKNTNKTKSVWGREALISLWDKIKSLIKLNILKSESDFVFLRKNDTYLRVQLIEDTAVLYRHVEQENKIVVSDTEVLLPWGAPRRNEFDLVFGGETTQIVAFLTEQDQAVVKCGSDATGTNEIAMKLNEPRPLFLLGENGEVEDAMLILVLTWIGDVHKK